MASTGQPDFNALIPDKLYFRIGEVAELLKVRPSALRYWEREFLFIRPTKSQSGQRLYRKNDVEIFFFIKYLLYEKGYTIRGAKRLIAKRHKVEESQEFSHSISSYRRVLEIVAGELEVMEKDISTALKQVDKVVKAISQPVKDAVGKVKPSEKSTEKQYDSSPNFSVHSVIESVKSRKKS